MANKVFGLLIMTFIAAIVGVALFQIVASNISGFTNTISVSNVTYTLANSATTNITDLTGQEYIPTALIYNATNDTQGAIGTSNITIGEGISATTGLKSVQLTTVDTIWSQLDVNVTYVYGPDGYIESSAGRNVTALILVFLAIGIMIAVIAIVMRPDFLGMLGRLRR